MAVKDNLFALFSASAHMAEARDRVCGIYPHQRRVQPHTPFLYQGAYALFSILTARPYLLYALRFFAAFAADNKICVIACFCKARTFLMKNSCIVLLVDTCHVTDFHRFTSFYYHATLLQAHLRLPCFPQHSL